MFRNTLRKVILFKRILFVRMSPNANSCPSMVISTTTSLANANIYGQFNKLRDACRGNLEFYHACSNPSEIERRFDDVFTKLLQNLDAVLPLYETIQNFAHEYDFDEHHPANGFRSFLYVVEKCLELTNKSVVYVLANKNALSFAVKRYQYIKEVEACSLLLENLTHCLEHLVALREWTNNGDLFPNSQHTAKEMLIRAHKIDQYSFYGRLLGFQFCKTMRPTLQLISTSMAGFSKSYDHDGSIIAKTTISFYNSGKYYFDSEARAKRIVSISRNAGVDFCKAFWFLAENRFMYSLPVLYGSRVKVNRVFHIPPEPFQIETQNGLMDVPVPMSHIGPGPVKVRLISNVERAGMVGVGNKSVQPASNALIIHCHGGGFIACSSASHEVYLREWSIKLNVPILSIDYSLAPKAPYPRALEEIFYVYCWALKNRNLLGSTCERIILAGDSAGANLCLTCSLKCIETGVRKPDGIFMAYTPTMVDFIPSPARLLCLMDPLLPFGFMMQCLKAYSSPSMQIIQRNKADVDAINSVKYAGREMPVDVGTDALQMPINNLTNDAAHVQTFKTKYANGTEDIPIFNNNNYNDEEVVIEVGKEVCEENLNLKQKLNQTITRLANKTGFTSSPKTSPKPKRTIKDIDCIMEKSASEDFTFEVSRDPHLSPFFASNEMLSQMPTVKIVSTNLDPCLDDCIMFGKKLKAIGNKVDLDVLSGLPHGFLNFVLLSKEAHEGNLLCIDRIRELINSQQ